MIEVGSDRIEAYRNLLLGREVDLLIDAVLRGNANARLWVSPQGTGASAALLWDPCNNVLYLGGNLSTSDRLAGLEVALDTIQTDCAQRGRRWLRGRGITEHARKALKSALGGIQPNTMRRRLYAYRQESLDLVRYPAPNGVEILPINRQLMEGRRPGNADAIIVEITKMWPSLDTYYRRGIGFAALAGDAAVCWCTAEYMGGSQCGIGIETVEDMQGRGVGTAVAARFVAECLERAVMPHWDCSLANPASMHLAEKLGFEAEGEAEFLAWSIPE